METFSQYNWADISSNFSVGYIISPIGGIKWLLVIQSFKWFRQRFIQNADSFEQMSQISTKLKTKQEVILLWLIFIAGANAGTKM